MQLSDLVDDVRPDCYGVPALAALDALQKAAASFFVQSSAWQERSDANPIQAGVFEYSLDVPSGARVARVLSVVLNGTRLRPLTEQEFFEKPVTTGDPAYFAISNTTQELLLWPTPSDTSTGSVSVMAVITPTREIVNVPDAILERWRDGIVAGAKARLMRAPGKPWSNPELSGINELFFVEETVKAKRESFGNQFVKPRTVRFIPF